MANIIKINSKLPETEHIEFCADIIKKRGVVIFPTKGLYGLGANAFDSKAVKKLFQIKKRSSQKPILILVDETYDWNLLVKEIPESAFKIIDAFWPGDITLIFKAKQGIFPKAVTGGTEKIGIRMTASPAAAQLVKAAGLPITGTSANLSGKQGCKNIQQIDETVINAVDLILDAGELEGGLGSTVVDLTVEPCKILREGRILKHEMQNIGVRLL